MSIKSHLLRFKNVTTTPISSYDQDLVNLGTLIKQYSGGANTDNFVGPSKIGLARPMEQSTAIPGIYPSVYRYDSIDMVYLADNAAAAKTRRIILYEYDRELSNFNWKGFITLTFPTATNHTVRGFKIVKENYTTGTVSVTGTAVTGVGSQWLTDRMCVGCRIGFGSTDPNAISTWHEISAITNDLSITLTSSAGTVAAGTSYVIEDLRALVTTTNATATNGGLYVVKGLRPEIFITTGTTVPAATTVDNIRAVYWLADAAVVTNTAACGAALEDMTSWTDQRTYVLDTAGPKVFVYNFRAVLTLAAGKDVTTNIIKTGNQAVTGTVSQTNNGTVATLSHGPGSGVASLYFATTTRVYRSAITSIVSSSTTWQSDNMVEVPPGGTVSYAATGVMSFCEYSSDIDRLVVMSTGAAGVRSYVTSYNTISSQFDHMFLNDDKHLDQASSDSGLVVHPTIGASTFSVCAVDGILYMARIAATAAANQVYTLPIGAHHTYAFTNDQLLITNRFDISDSNKLYYVVVGDIQKLGTDAFSISPEPYKLYYRTSGISTNTGAWTLVDDTGDLSGISGTEIQFAIAFKTIGLTCVPSRISSISLVYEDDTTDSHYEPSVANSSLTSNIFAYRQKTSWGSNIPNMRIRLYNAANGLLVLDDDVLSSAFGAFEYSSNGGTSWNPWLNTADAVGNYIRYTATTLPAGTRIRALLTQA